MIEDGMRGAMTAGIAGMQLQLPHLYCYPVVKNHAGIIQFAEAKQSWQGLNSRCHEAL